MDFASRWATTILYPLGISTAPTQVIIGKNGWLFLSSMYDSRLSEYRKPTPEIDQLTAKNIEDAVAAWDAYLSSRGVKLFRIMIGPNKDTIYPENTPFWARPASPTPADALFAADTGRYYVDLRPALLDGKQSRKEAIYFKTDTHWNAIGAGIAFKDFARQIAMVAPEINWPDASIYDLVKVIPKDGGDLAYFLRMNSILGDVEPITKVSGLPLSITQVDFDTGKILSSGPNVSISQPTKPLLVKSSGALNNKKVLWLRDSFGNSLSPLMAATFTDVMHLHWTEALKPEGPFARLVNDWRPDYVFVTVVERSAQSSLFTVMPPPSFLNKDESFKSTASTLPNTVNHLVRGVTEGEYEISGDLAFVDFALSQPVAPKATNYLSMDFLCADGSASVPIQIFWLEEGMPYFDEAHSAKLPLRTGKYLLDLRSVPKWSSAAAVSRVRIDIDSSKSCRRFQMSNPVFGI